MSREEKSCPFFFESKTFEYRGKNPEPGIFPKAAINAKTAFLYEQKRSSQGIISNQNEHSLFL
ncbi:hypothetical protein D3H55_03350 [Bacillus salacetis]|uniref:Uncharacterized protein n=1 Tax=Bacillus salacetis TaxID=2315464 RepID=A0A3A1R7Z6_9BACI|nr:hypothetical protein D3H55_03350 [Bacillus salacetis]